MCVMAAARKDVRDVCVLLYVAVCCSVLQCLAMSCNETCGWATMSLILFESISSNIRLFPQGHFPQNTATECNILQRCMLQYVEVQRSLFLLSLFISLSLSLCVF